MHLTELLSCLEKLPSYVTLVEDMKKGAPELWANGLYGSARSLFLATLRKDFPTPFLFIAPTVEEAEKTEDDLKSIFKDDIFLFPARETLSGDSSISGSAVTSDRLTVLEKLLSSTSQPIIITPFQAVCDQVITPSVLRSRTIKLTSGEKIDRDSLIKKLVDYGYEHTAMVEYRGNFSRRGGILDIYPGTGEHPFRLEFFADTIQSIRVFSVASQRSLDKKNKITILPATEPSLTARHKNLTNLLAYFPPESVIFIDEPAKIRADIASALDGNENPLTLFNHILSACREKKHVVYTSLLPQTIPETESIVRRENFYIQSLENYQGQFDECINKIKSWQEDGYRLVFICNNEGEKKRLKELLAERGLKEGKKLSVCLARLQSGFLIPEIKLALITDQELFGRYRLRRPRRHFKGGIPLSHFTDLQDNDYVVHVNQGIGKYLGMEKMSVDGRERDFLTIEYLNNDKLYIPIEELRLVQKYVGVESRPPRFSKLGSRAWERTKEKIKKSIRDLAGDLLEVHAAREIKEGFSFAPDTTWQREFETAFLYEETTDQLKTLEEIKKDMEMPKPMDRLICGDVGFGKTEVAIRAAFKCVMDSKQVAILVPTTILAKQHHVTFSDRMADYPVRVAMLSRFKTPAEQKNIIEGLKNGTVDIVIGTHRLLQKDIVFQNLGLVIVDEEQRFGVTHKEKLKKLRKLVDVLTLTATPIPRTLHMSLMGMKDMSVIDTPPEDRLPVRTIVTEYNETTINEAIHQEMHRNGQVFFVHNRVESIEEMANNLRRIVPEARIAIAHGQMKEKQLEKVMNDFLDYKIDVLVATTIIESGLDIPNVNTIIINRADAFGLADLYQLRGRVGRFKHLAFAYLLYPKYLALSEISQKRLKAIEEFSDLGSGFRIAMRDLQIRGAGNLLGPQQHGHIIEIGFDLYCNLLRQTVQELKGEKIETEPITHLDLNLDAYIPDDYIPDLRQRLSLYRRLAVIFNQSNLKDLKEELKDRFGALPSPVTILLSSVAIRVKASRLGITYLGLKGGQLIAKFQNGQIVNLDLNSKEQTNPIPTIEKFLKSIKISTSGPI